MRPRKSIRARIKQTLVALLSLIGVVILCFWSLHIRRYAKIAGQSSFLPIRPPSFPLAVRGPYISAWLPAGPTRINAQGAGGYLAGQPAAFWTSSFGGPTENRLGWTGLIRVDGKSYQWMGESIRAGDIPNVRQISVEYTATRTIFSFQAAAVKFNVTFLSPVTPADYLRQSLPLSYLHVELEETTRQGASVQIYTDIDERWVTGHDSDYEAFPYNMQFQIVNSTSMYLVQRDHPEVYTEYSQRAEWGSAVYAVRNIPSLSSRNNNQAVTQLEFLHMGNLTFDHDRVQGPANSFAYAVDFTAPGSPSDVLFAVGHLRSPYLNYVRTAPSSVGQSYQQARYGYWQAFFPNFTDATAFFLNDFDNSLANAKVLDAQISSDSKKAVGGDTIGDHYAAITQLAVRQALGALEITISRDESGAFNASDAMIFVKEISSNGDMSTVDVLFPLFPLLAYLNPQMLRDALEPLYIYAETLYPNKWAPHDLGAYPNGTGHLDGGDEAMQVEESGNMIWMSLLYAQLAGPDKAVPWLRQHYKIMNQWTSFLIADSLIPSEQLSTDDFAGKLANQTNLAIKGIIGIAAMAQIAQLCGEQNDAANIRSVSSRYVQAWANHSISHDRSHLKLAYQNDSSNGLLYNLLGDRMLNLQLVPKSIYTVLDDWYPKVIQKFGLPLDSRHMWSKSDWAMFAAAASASIDAREKIIDGLFQFVSNGSTSAPFTDWYDPEVGDLAHDLVQLSVHFVARPVQGALFSFLARDRADAANGVEAYEYASEFPYGPDS